MNTAGHCRVCVPVLKALAAISGLVACEVMQVVHKLRQAKPTAGFPVLFCFFFFLFFTAVDNFRPSARVVRRDRQSMNGLDRKKTES